MHVVIVDKTGTLKNAECKDMSTLYKKCGFKSDSGFCKHGEFKVKVQGNAYVVSVYGKINGKAGTENKYDFPPPIDHTLFFGACALVAHTSGQLVGLQVPLWELMYERLFQGFEDLAATALQDEMEEDELDHIPSHMKTKEGYLKDGFVVDDLLEDDEEGEEYDDGELCEDDYLE